MSVFAPERRIWRMLALLLGAGLCLPAWAAWVARPLHEVAIYPERNAQAQVVSLNESRVAAEIHARILRLPPEPGETLARGAVLAELDCRDLELAADSAQAALAASEAEARLAQRQQERAAQLAQERFISRDLLDTRTTELEAAQARVAVQRAAWRSARRQVEKCVVRAPFPAVVLERLAQEGELATPGTPLVRLLDRSRIQVRAAVQTADLAGLRAARAPAFVSPEGHFPLRLLRASPAVAGSTRLAEARLVFQGETAPAGSSGQVRWRSPEPHLPPQVLVRRGGRLGVFVVEAAAGAQPRFLALDAAQEGRPSPATGLPAGVKVVVQGAGALR